MQNAQRNTTNFAISPNSDQHKFSNDIHASSKEKFTRITPFAVYHEKIRIRLHETVINSAKICSLE